MGVCILLGKQIGNYEPNYFCITAQEAGYCGVVIGGATAPSSYNVQMSKDKSTWTDISTSSYYLPVSAGESVYFKAKTKITSYTPPSDGSYISYGVWDASSNIKKFKASGNVMSLYDPSCESTVMPGPACFRCLFAGLWDSSTSSAKGTGLTDASELIMPTITNASTQYNCFEAMFAMCPYFTTPISLQSTTLAPYCYNLMFAGSGITSAPELPATTLEEGCYNSMFSICASLSTPPSLPATTLAPGCYYSMFNGSAITTCPNLPATTAEHSCYFAMFNNCYAITSAPTIALTTLADSCCEAMFASCQSLKYGTDLKATTMKPRCYALMYYMDASLQTTGKISATTTAYQACYAMFKNSPALTTVPKLYSTTLAEQCYAEMFNLGEVIHTNIFNTGYTSTYRNTYRIPTSGTGSVGTNSLLSMFQDNINTNTAYTPSINTTYYTRLTVV